jgi:hypothetical protein
MSVQDHKVIPLKKRQSDIIFVLGFSCFALTSFIFDSQTGFDADLLAPDAGVFTQINAWFAQTADPLLLAPPLWLRICCLISTFVYGPFYLLLVMAFIRGDERIRTPALVYVGAIELSMVLCFAEAFFGEVRPTHMPLFLCAYFPFALLPALLAYRMRESRPFTAMGEGLD